MAPYQNTIFVNLSVSDLDRSVKFYTAIGFVQCKAVLPISTFDTSHRTTIPFLSGWTYGKAKIVSRISSPSSRRPWFCILTFRQFSNDKAVMMSLPATPTTPTSGPQAHETPIKIMLLTQPFFKGFLPKSLEIADPIKVAHCLVCISRESREGVDAFVEAALKTGGRKIIREKSEAEVEAETGGMYGGVVADPDGHILEAVYMAKEMYEGAE